METISLDALIGHYYSSEIHCETLSAVSDTLSPGEYSSIYHDFPEDPILIQKRLLHEYEKTRNIRYLHAYNEIAIRAKRLNESQEEESFPISETYPEFQLILSKKGLTLSDLTWDWESVQPLLL